MSPQAKSCPLPIFVLPMSQDMCNQDNIKNTIFNPMMQISNHFISKKNQFLSLIDLYFQNKLYSILNFIQKNVEMCFLHYSISTYTISLILSLVLQDLKCVLSCPLEKKFASPLSVPRLSPDCYLLCTDPQVHNFVKTTPSECLQ